MNPAEAIVVASPRGATGFLPVSSLGNAAVPPALPGWSLDQPGATILPFPAMPQVGTAVALLLCLRRDWLALAGGVVGAVGTALGAKGGCWDRPRSPASTPVPAARPSWCSHSPC